MIFADQTNQPPNAPVKGRIILVAEDDKFYSNIYKEKLSREGYLVSLAANGEEVLQSVQEKKPDLILLDLIMPKMDGFETLKELRKHQEIQNLKIVVVSNLGQQEDIKKAKDLGATDYLVKTNMSIQEMMEKIKYYLSI